MLLDTSSSFWAPSVVAVWAGSGLGACCRSICGDLFRCGVGAALGLVGTARCGLVSLGGDSGVREALMLGLGDGSRPRGDGASRCGVGAALCGGAAV